METLKQLLVEHPFLKGLEERYIDLLVGCASNVRFNANQYIFRENQEAEQFFIIRKGKVALQLNAPGRGTIIIGTIAEGDILGWSWLFPPYHWHFDAKALDTTLALALDGKCLRTKCESDHDLGYELLKRFSPIIENRLEATRLQLLDVYHVHS